MTLQEATARLREVGIENADWEARQLFCHFGGLRPSDLIGTDPDVSAPALTDAIRRRIAREPLQYILGEVGFYRESYLVTPACLIPRPDTELLVEEAIRRLPPQGTFADFCTGSGCIAISVLCARTDLTADAYDISEDALALARKNAERNGVADRIRFHACDILTTPPTAAWDAILSNPPYIPTETVDTLLPELSHEPRIALDGGPDGMDFYRAILGGTSAPLYLFEIGYDQKEAIEALASVHGYPVEVLTDLGGNPRCAVIKKK